MLAMLATIYRQRSELKKAASVMELDECVLIRYEHMVSRLGVADPSLLEECHGLRFKYNRIRYNLLMGQHLESPDIATLAAGVPSVIRDLMRHEIQSKFTSEEQDYAFYDIVTNSQRSVISGSSKFERYGYIEFVSFFDEDR
jgi:hypothetical protein